VDSEREIVLGESKYAIATLEAMIPNAHGYGLVCVNELKARLIHYEELALDISLGSIKDDKERALGAVDRVYRESPVTDIANIPPGDMALKDVKTLAGVSAQVAMLRNVIGRDLHGLGIATTNIIPSFTKFDIQTCEDSEYDRRKTDDPNQHNIIFRVIEPGVTIDGQLVRKAQVRRYVYEGRHSLPNGQPSETTPVHQSSSQTELGRVEGISATDNILLQAINGAGQPELTALPSDNPKVQQLKQRIDGLSDEQFAEFKKRCAMANAVSRAQGSGHVSIDEIEKVLERIL